jgi:acyl transferase domain-containing protein
VIRGSALAGDGRGNGMLSTSGLAHQQDVRHALANAALPADHVDAVDGHGSGTPLGDAIEANALLATYGQERRRPLWLGSVKSNIAHCQAAAGMAGVIKMTQAMRHGLLPRTLHVDQPVPHADWEHGQVRVLTEPMAWPDTGRPRRAGVSGIGISGVHAHVILEQPPPPDTHSGPSHTPPVLPWVIAATNETALRAQAQRLARHPRPDHDPLDTAYSLATTRTAFASRAVLIVHRGVAGALVRTPDAVRDTELPANFAAATEAYLRGADVDWTPVFAGTGARAVPLPTYPFQHRRFWLSDAPTRQEETR